MANKVITQSGNIISIVYNDQSTECVEKCAKMAFSKLNVYSVKLTNENMVELYVNGDTVCLSISCVDTIAGAAPSDIGDLYNKIVALL